MEPTLQIGDMGIGFKKRNGWDRLTVGDMLPKDKWFAGNHDHRSACAKEQGYLGNFGVTNEGIFFVSGAFSVDAFSREVGSSWWPDEQLSTPEFEEALQLYSELKPEIMATHDCPRIIYPKMLEIRYDGRPAPLYENITASWLDRMLAVHKPKVWVFGHWHRACDFDFDGVRYICADELQPVTLEF